MSTGHEYYSYLAILHKNVQSESKTYVVISSYYHLKLEIVKLSISIEAYFSFSRSSLFSLKLSLNSFSASLYPSVSWQSKMSFEGPFVSITWGFVALGSYLTYCILKYLKEKPPNAQTLLDGIHRQMLWIWTVENWMILLHISVLVWGFKSEITAWIFGYGTIFVVSASAIHLTICVVTRIGLVFFQDEIETIPEHLILNGTM